MKKVLITALVTILAVMGIVSPVLAATPVPTTVDLIADGGADGEQLNVGDLSVSYDGSNLNIVFTTVDGWEMDETHLYVSTAAPTKSSPGKFPYKHEELGWLTSDPYSIALAPGDYYIAAHAEVRLLTGYDTTDPLNPIPIYRYESLWAEGSRFGKGANWAMCFQVTILE
jgi:hypothetical protein